MKRRHTCKQGTGLERSRTKNATNDKRDEISFPRIFFPVARNSPTTWLSNAQILDSFAEPRDFGDKNIAQQGKVNRHSRKRQSAIRNSLAWLRCSCNVIKDTSLLFRFLAFFIFAFSLLRCPRGEQWGGDTAENAL